MRSASQPPLPPPSRPNLRIVAIGIGVIVIVVVALFVLYSFLSPHGPSIVSAAQVSQSLGENYKLQYSSTFTNVNQNALGGELGIFSILTKGKANLVLSSTFVSDSGAKVNITVIQYSNQSIAANLLNNLKLVVLFNGTPISVSGSIGYYVKLGNIVMIVSQYNNYVIILYYVKGNGKMPTQQQFLALLDAQIKSL